MKFVLKASVAVCLAFLLLGCGPTAEEEAAQMVADVNNMCAEIASTTVGFSGPSKRIEIMGKYGIEPTVASNLNAILEQGYESSKNKKEAANDYFAAKYQCYVDLSNCQGNALLIKTFLESDNSEVLINDHIAHYLEQMKEC